MTVPNANPEGDAPTPTPDVDIVKLQQQVENLNKGIAKYREESQKSSVEVANLKKQLEEKSKSSTKAADDELELNAEDQKRLEAWAKKQGFVTKGEFEQERLRIQQESFSNIENQAVDEFLRQHPEYDKDEEWEKVKVLFSEYKTPTSLTQYRKLLAKIHSELNPKEDKGSDKARAEIETKRRLGLGGGMQKRPSGDSQTIESLMEKYPSLSRDQIEAQLASIKSLYPKKDK